MEKEPKEKVNGRETEKKREREGEKMFRTKGTDGSEAIRRGW